MEFHELMAIGHAGHVFWNPVSDDAFERLLQAADLERGARVLDIACGPAELLIRLAERHGTRGVGVDVSPWALARAREAAEARVPEADLEFVEMDGAAYDGPAAGFDAVCLVGASWIWKGYRGTLRALRRWVRPGGLVWFGEPYWKVSSPPLAYCEAEGDMTPDSFTDLEGLRQAAIREGLRLVYLEVSADQDFDRYEMLQSLATDRWVRAHPDHPDVEQVLGFQDLARERYLRWGREALGFAQFLLRAE